MGCSFTVVASAGCGRRHDSKSQMEAWFLSAAATEADAAKQQNHDEDDDEECYQIHSQAFFLA